MKKRKHEETLEQLQTIVDDDCANGRHVQKKLKKKIQEKGSCIDSFIKEIQILKAVK